MSAKKTRIMYIEDKSSSLNGLARVGRVTFSKTGRSLHYGMGAGSVGVAAAVKGRSFIGIELSAAYFDIADDRVSSAHLTARENQHPDRHEIAA